MGLRGSFTFTFLLYVVILAKETNCIQKEEESQHFKINCLKVNGINLYQILTNIVFILDRA
jgi:hypothetical protein